MQFPLVVGGFVPVVNLDAVKSGQLKLTGPVLADIYLGKVTKWNDSSIAALITDAPGKDAWPIAATTFVLMQRQPKDPVASAGALEFFKWALESGQADAKKLDYVPLPASLVPQIVEYWSKSEQVSAARVARTVSWLFAGTLPPYTRLLRIA